MKKADVGLVGLAVMGQNLALNIADHGFSIAVFNRTAEKTKAFLEKEAKGKSIQGTKTLQEFVSTLARPRRIILMVKAGGAVDDYLDQLLPLLEEGDIVIDGGNSWYLDTERRCKFLQGKGLHFIGAGISGGEEGARHGPSIMPGGDEKAWETIKPIFCSIAARAEDGTPCCAWMGPGGAGHYVKMIHNGIEYGDMQLICEACDLLRRGAGLSLEKLSDLFAQWNEGALNSYLIEITVQILRKKDVDGSYLVDKVLDVAGQKGTGKWSVTEALDLGIPATLIAESVFARGLSTILEDRALMNTLYPTTRSQEGNEKLAEQCEMALYASKIVSYAQGFMLLQKASENYQWSLPLGDIARIWRGGCIIRSRFLNQITEAFERNPDLKNLLMDSFFVEEIHRVQMAWRTVVVRGAQRAIPMPCMSAGLAFFDGMRSARLPAYLLQAQRDCFGSHTYERVDRPRGQFFHSEWME